MPRKKIKVTIKNKEENITYHTSGIIEENHLKYKENKDTTLIYDYEENKLTRENKKLRMDYFFDKKSKTEGTIQVKELGRTITLPIITNKIVRKEEDIEIEYQIEDNIFLWKVEVEK